jgi:NAD(P)-dependent dehydrogenase (short-subunit alcohol dehydrogenase family)
MHAPSITCSSHATSPCDLGALLLTAHGSTLCRQLEFALYWHATYRVATLLLCQYGCRINNAGSNGYKYGVLGDYTDAELVNIVETNVLGVMLGCREVRNALCLPVWNHSYKQPG